MSLLIKHVCQINPVLPISLPYLPSFIRLVDYLVVNTLHSLVVNAVATLLVMLQDKICQTPSRATIESWNQRSVASTGHADEEVGNKLI